MPLQNIYEYEKLKTIEKFYCINNGIDKIDHNTVNDLRNKINELVINYNKMAKDLELYKKAYKDLYISL